MSQERRGIFQKVSTFLLNIGADPADSEEKAKSESLLRRIEADLAQAARIQEDLLPKESPKIAGYDINGINVPCYEVGGDYYDYVPVDPDVRGYACGTQPCDDITLVVLKRTEA